MLVSTDFFYTSHLRFPKRRISILHQFAISKGQAKYCCWFRNPKQSPGMVLKPCKQWDNLPYKLVGWISEPSTVSLDKVAKTHPKNAPVAVHCHHNHQVQGCAAAPVPWPPVLGWALVAGRYLDLEKVLKVVGSLAESVCGVKTPIENTCEYMCISNILYITIYNVWT